VNMKANLEAVVLQDILDVVIRSDKDEDFIIDPEVRCRFVLFCLSVNFFRFILVSLQRLIHIICVGDNI
jgi:hypothetical protein